MDNEIDSEITKVKEGIYTITLTPALLAKTELSLIEMRAARKNMTKLRTSSSRRGLTMAAALVLAFAIALPGVHASKSIVAAESSAKARGNSLHQRTQVPAQQRQPLTTNEPIETKKANAEDEINRSMVQYSAEGGQLSAQLEPQALPNLTPFQPSGWSDEIVVSNALGTHTDSNPLRTTDTLYVDWAVINNGGSATSARFYTKLFVDGVDTTNWYSDPALNPTFYAYIEDYSIGSLSAGTHTIRIVADAFNAIAESSESDNEYTKTITVSPTALPNLTPFQPSGWSDKIVVSTVAGTHTDGNPLRTTDTLYVDWAVINNGGSPTSVRFYTKLFVDGIEKTSWYSDPPVNSTFYVHIEDYSIGSLSAGTHTLRIVADAFNDIPESNEFDNEYTKTITVNLPTVPNLMPFQPSGWSDKIVVSPVTGTHSDGTTLRTTDTLYVDWAVINNGSGATAVRFFTKLFVDGVEKNSWFTDPPLNVTSYAVVEDYSIGSLTTGSHTIRIVADAFNDIGESNEFDNEYTKTITVISTALPNLTPYQPSGWSDKIIIATATGTHSDSSPLRTTDTLYLDWAVVNNGGAATSIRFYTKLFVDGVEKGSWFSDPPVNGNTHVYIEDFPIGILSAGSHTIRIVADALSNIAESNEFDNDYTKTINVSAAACNTLTINVSPSEGGSISKTPEPSCFSSLEVLPPADFAQSLNQTPTKTSSVDGLSRPAAMTERFRNLISKAESSGPVRVIVGLRVSFQPEGKLSTQAVQSQRRSIAQLQDVLLARMSAFNVQSVKRFETIPYLAMDIDAAGLKDLESSPDVSSIEEDVAVPPTLAESVPLIGAPNAWAAGFSGAGQTVAILDTGVDKIHPFLAGKIVSEACFSTTGTTSTGGSFSSVCPGGALTSTALGSGVNCPFSACDHGTHVAGIVSGKGSSFSGVAKDASIIAIQVFSLFNSSTDCGDNPTPCAKSQTSDQIMGLERVLALAGSFNIASVNMSLGGGKFTSNCDAQLPSMKSAIDNLRSRGIATIIASGNDGHTDGISFPGCISSAVSVGSTDDGSLGTGVDVVSDFGDGHASNSAFFLNLLAPGKWIYSSLPNGRYENFQGTSMATPHVAGAWAILKSKAPSASVDQILAALTSTGVSITDFRNGIVKPRIRVDAALNALAGGGVLRYGSDNVVTLTANPNSGFAFVKWQRDGVDFSTNRVVSVSMNIAHTMTAVFRVGNSGPTISSVTLDSPKVTRILGSAFSQSPRVLINGVDRSDLITTFSDSSITLKGKQKKVGLRAGDNNVQVIDASGSASNVFVLRL